MLSVHLNEWWTRLYFLIFRPMLKWLLHHVTGKCELLRISYEETDKSKRTKRIEYSLKKSSHHELRKYATGFDYSVEESVKKIMEVKNVVPEIHSEFEDKIRDSLLRIRAYNKILDEAERLRKTKFSSECQDHEDKLTKMWTLFQGAKEPLPGRVGEHWTSLGFQGHDPQTDFRGMGMLGLEQLIFFATTYPEESKKVFSQSHHPQYGFSFAIVGINLTEMGYTLMSKRKLQSHFYSLSKQEPDLADYHQIYCYLLYEFTQFWHSEKPKDIMEFSHLRSKFHKKVKSKLKGSEPILISSYQQKQCSS